MWWLVPSVLSLTQRQLPGLPDEPMAWVEERDQEARSLREQAEGQLGADEVQLGGFSSEVQLAAPTIPAAPVSFAEADTADPELTNGAPKEGFVTCGSKGDECECEEGTVRLGSRDKNSWTQPVHLGERTGVKCDAGALQKLRAHFSASEGNVEPLGCQCIDRRVRISIDFGNGPLPTSEKLEEAQKTASGLVEERTTSNHMCLVQRSAIPADAQMTGSLTEGERQEWASLQELQRVQAAVVEGVAMEECKEGVPEEEWVFLLSSGQLKHVGTQKCLTADFAMGAPLPKLDLQACTLLESQYKLQRWELPAYISPKFEVGTGIVRLAYGGHTTQALCLQLDEHYLNLGGCSSPEVTEWTIMSLNEKHEWATCAAEEKECTCTGEVRFGDGEAGVWTAGVPVEGSVSCDLHQLQALALKDPDTLDVAEECQCIHDPFTDGTLSQIKASVERTQAASSSSTGMIVGIVGGVALLGLVVALYLRKQREAGGEGEEEWAEEEEEWAEGEEEGEY